MTDDKAYEFVCKLFNTYRFSGTQWEVDSQMDNYYNCLKQTESETGKEYDYDRMYRLIEKEYKYKAVPQKSEVTKWQKRCIKHNYDTSRDGELVLFLCYGSTVDGHYQLKEVREYTVSNNDWTKSTEKETDYKLRQIYDEVTVKHYKKGSSLLLGTVYIPIKYNELGEAIEYKKEKVA